MTELLDLYDDQDNPLGVTKLRSEVHRDGDWHREAHIYVVNLSGQILVQLRSPNKDKYPNMWDTKFGGHVAAGDDYDDTAIRELHEEIGIDADLLDVHFLDFYSIDKPDDRRHVKSYYYLFMGEDSEIHFKDGEVSKVKWMDPEEIIAEMKALPEKWCGSPERFEEILSSFKNI